MALSQVLEILDLLDGPVRGPEVAEHLCARGLDVEATSVAGQGKGTDFAVAVAPGSGGKRGGGDAPTTGVIGRLGGIGARPEAVGMVSDADGAVAALAAALKLATMAARGDVLPGDVVIATHICPDAPTEPHDPVPFMGSPCPMETLNAMEVRPEMDAILSVDATKGNRIVNHKGIALTPTVKDGYLLAPPPALLDLYERVTGRRPVVMPLTTADITPYGNGLVHVNSILQPAVATDKPVVGVAVTAETTIPGCATGANDAGDIALAAAFCIEAAKALGAGQSLLYDPAQYELAMTRYGSMSRLRTMGEDPDAAGAREVAR